MSYLIWFLLEKKFSFTFFYHSFTNDLYKSSTTGGQNLFLRSVFTLDPNILLVIWTPVILGENFKYFCTSACAHMKCWQLITIYLFTRLDRAVSSCSRHGSFSKQNWSDQVTTINTVISRNNFVVCGFHLVVRIAGHDRSDLTFSLCFLATFLGVHLSHDLFKKIVSFVVCLL